MAFSGTRAGFAAFWTTVFIFVVFGKKFESAVLFQELQKILNHLCLRLRCYRNVKKSWSTTKMNEKMCCLVFTFSAKMSTLYSRENENGDKTCLHYEPPQPSRPENAIMKTGLKRFVPAHHRYDVCHCRHGLIALAPSFPSVAYQIFCKILSTTSHRLISKSE